MQLLKTSFKQKLAASKKETFTREELLLRFIILNPDLLTELHIAKTKYVSEISICFRTVSPPPRKAYILLNLNQRILMGETRKLVVDGSILARVTNTHLNLENGLFDVDCEFVSETAKNSGELAGLIQQCKAISNS